MDSHKDINNNLSQPKERNQEETVGKETADTIKNAHAAGDGALGKSDELAAMDEDKRENSGDDTLKEAEQY